MLRYILVFVLVMIMIETKAQNPWGATESDTVIYVRIDDSATNDEIDTLEAHLAGDPDFTNTSGNDYYLLIKKSSSSITKTAAISRYMAEPAVAYASFVYDEANRDNGNSFFAIADDILVKLKPAYDENDIETVAIPEGLIAWDYILPDLNIYRLTFDKTGNTIDRVATLVNSGICDYAEPNYIMANITNTIYSHPSSSHYDCPPVDNTLDNGMVNKAQWSLYTGRAVDFNPTFMNTTYYNGTTFISTTGDEWTDINVCNAWTYDQGSAQLENISGNGIIVAVLDDGVDADHYDLNIRLNGVGYAYGYDAMPRNNPINVHAAAPDLGANHGTGCAGIIAAKRNNTSSPGVYDGMTGIAYDAKIMPVRMFSVTGGVYTTNAAAIASALVWSVNNSADVISNSYGNGYSAVGALSVEQAIDYALNNGRGGKGCVVVFSSGNDNCMNISWPSSHSGVISVGAMSMCNQRVSMDAVGLHPCNGLTFSRSCDNERWGSNYGSGRVTTYTDNNASPPVTYTLNANGKVSVVAPGVRIYTTTQNGGFTNTFNGTSSSCPHVSGVAALLLSVNSCLTTSEVKDIIELSADKFSVQQAGMFPYGNYSYTQDVTNPFKSWDNQVGHGKLNAGNAVALAYDLYLQGKEETGTEVYNASHFIYAGARVTDVKPYVYTGMGIFPGYYVRSGANVTFNVKPGESVILDDGFLAENGSEFLADPNVSPTCNNSDHHQKPGKGNERKNKAIVERIPKGKSPILSSSDAILHGIRIYPNPAQDEINIEFALENAAVVDFTMLNLVGQVVREKQARDFAVGIQKHTMSLQGLAPGVYFVGINTPSGYSQFRFVKK